MKKTKLIAGRLAAALLALVVCAGVLGTAALAEGEPAQAVAKTGEETFPTLQTALDAVQDGGTVTLLEDVAESVFVVGKSFTLDLGGKTLTSNGGTAVSVTLESGNSVTIRNGRITGGGAEGRGIYISANDADTKAVLEELTVSGFDFLDSPMDMGAALYVAAATTSVSGCIFESSTFGYAAVYLCGVRKGFTTITGEAALTGCEFKNNAGSGSLSAAVCASVPTTFDACVFSGNSAVRAGAVYVSTGAAVTITGCTFENNTAVCDENDKCAGAVTTVNSKAKVTVSGSRFTGNSSRGMYGAIANAGTVTLTDTEVTYNYAANSDHAAAGGIGGGAVVYVSGAVYGNTKSPGVPGDIYIESPESELMSLDGMTVEGVEGPFVWRSAATPYEDEKVWPGKVENVSGRSFYAAVAEAFGSLTVTKTVSGGGEEAANKVYAFTVTGPSCPDGAELTVTGGGSATLEDLAPGEYAVTECDAEIEGYTLNVTGEAAVTVEAGKAAEVAVTNTYTQKLGSLTIAKEVVGGGHEAANKAYTFTVTGPSYPDGHEVTVTGSNCTTLTGLIPGTYTVTEQDANIDGYTWTVNGAGEVTVEAEKTASVTVTNTYEPILISIPVEKFWKNIDGNVTTNNLPDSVTVDLYVNGEKSEKSVTFTAETDWKGTFENLPETDENGNKINYTVDEVTVPGWTKSVEGFTITNTRNEPGTTGLSVTKRFVEHDGVTPATENLPASVTVRLYKNGEPTETTVELNAGNNWTGSFANLPEQDVNGNLITYTLAEDDVPGWTSASVNDGANWTITNTRDTISITVNKVWLNLDGTTAPVGASVTVTLFRDGAATEMTATLSAENGWSCTFTGLEAGHVYTVVETVGFDGYTALEPVFDETTGWTITNKQNVKKIDIPVQKVWKNIDGTETTENLPDSVTVYLYVNGQKSEKSVTLNAANNWTDTFDNLPETDEDGNAITYTVDEVEVPGWSKSIEGYTITNTRGESEKTDISVKKVWKNSDGSDAAANIPPDLTVTLYSGENVVDTTVLNAGNGWAHTFTGLDKNDINGNPINYTVQESPVDGWTQEGLTGNAATGFTFTNTRNEPGTTGLSVTKRFVEHDGVTPATEDLPAFVTVRLYENGEPTETTVELNAANNWTGSFAGLPEQNVNGNAINYTLAEDDVPGWTSASVNDGINWTITNTRDTISLTVNKTWLNLDGIGTAPEGAVVTVTLVRDGAATEMTATLSAENGWTYTFAGLEVGHVYTVVETVGFDGYTALDPVFDETTGWTITNKQNVKKIDIPVQKVWKNIDGTETTENLPESVTVYLYVNGQKSEKSVTLNAANNWTDTFDNLPETDESGKAITYTVDEVTVSGWSKSIDGFTVTNTRNKSEQTEISVKKVWKNSDGSAATTNLPASVTVTLLRNGEAAGQAALNAGNDWAHTFGDLDKYDINGNPILYTVQESPVDGWTQEGLTGDAATGFTFTNKRNEPGTTGLSVTKRFVEHDGVTPATEDLPVSVTVRLYENSKPTETTVELNAANNWTGSFTGLPEKDVNGNAINYTLVEDDVQGWISTSVNDGTNWTITNTRDTISITVNKTWLNLDGTSAAPEGAAVTVTLFRDGAATDTTATLSAANGWTYTFTGLEVGHVYTVVETVFEGYTAAYSENINGTITVTNTQTPPPPPGVSYTSVSVRKVWNDAGFEAQRPESVEVQLYRDGAAYGAAVTLSEANGWSYTWQLLDDEYDWTVDEVNAPAGYASTVTGNGADFVITNTYTVPEPEFGSLTVAKAVEGLDEADRSYTFTVTGPEGYSTTVTVPANGSVTLTGLVPGDYTVTEDVNDAEVEGYMLVDVTGEGSVEVAADATANIQVTNVYEPETEIPDEPPPLTDLPDVPPPLTEIPDDDVPLDDLPETGDKSRFGAWLALMASSLTGAIAFLHMATKTRNEKEPLTQAAVEKAVNVTQKNVPRGDGSPGGVDENFPKSMGTAVRLDGQGRQRAFPDRALIDRKVEAAGVSVSGGEKCCQSRGRRPRRPAPPFRCICRAMFQYNVSERTIFVEIIRRMGYNIRRKVNANCDAHPGKNFDEDRQSGGGVSEKGGPYEYREKVRRYLHTHKPVFPGLCEDRLRDEY